MTTKAPRTHRADVNARNGCNAGQAYDRGRRRADPALREAARIRSSARWRKFRARHKRRWPSCYLCQRMAEHSHHIIGLVDRPDLAYTTSNVVSLCRACHVGVEAKVRQGKETAPMFKDWDGIVQECDSVRHG